MAALPHREVAAALDATRTSAARRVVKLAFEFLVLTAARSGEVRGAQWAEIDLAERLWTIPAKRMKTNREHRRQDERTAQTAAVLAVPCQGCQGC